MIRDHSLLATDHLNLLVRDVDAEPPVAILNLCATSGLPIMPLNDVTADAIPADSQFLVFYSECVIFGIYPNML